MENQKVLMAALKKHLHLLQSSVGYGWTPQPDQDMMLSVEEWHPSPIIPRLTEWLSHYHCLPYNIASDQGDNFYSKGSSAIDSLSHKSLDLSHAPVSEANWEIMLFKVMCSTAEWDIFLKPAVNILCRNLWVQNPKGEEKECPFHCCNKKYT